MIIATFKTPEGEYDTCTYESAEDLNCAIYTDHSMDSVVGLWEVNE